MTSILTNTWMNDVRFLAQAAHALAGAFVVLLVAFFVGGTVSALVAAAAVMTYAGVKEFWYDATYELPKQTSFDNWLDFTFYGVGCLISIGLVLLKAHLLGA